VAERTEPIIDSSAHDAPLDVILLDGMADPKPATEHT
jgi:hypothetical protein